MNFYEQLHPTFDRWERRVQRWIWLVMLLALILALLGLFGGGPLSTSTETLEADGARVEVSYSRFNRARNDQALEVVVSAPGAGGDQISLALDGEWTDRVEIGSVLPEPDSTALGPEGRIYRWQVDDWSEELRVTINYTPQEWRRLEGRLTVSIGDQQPQSLAFKQFLFP